MLVQLLVLFHLELLSFSVRRCRVVGKREELERGYGGGVVVRVLDSIGRSVGGGGRKGRRAVTFAVRSVTVFVVDANGRRQRRVD